MEIIVSVSIIQKARKVDLKMNKFFQRLFLYEKSEIKTKLSKREILKKIDSFADPEYTDYYGGISEDGFFIAEKSRKYFIGGHSHNSFAPVAKAKITECDGMTTVSMVIRMNLLVLIFFAPIYITSLLTVVLFPFMRLILHFAFVMPAKRLKEKIEDILIADGIY